MIRLTAALTMLAVVATASAEAQTMLISRVGSRPVRPAPAENFTGERAGGNAVRGARTFTRGWRVRDFEPGARTAWHSHPRGQILIVTAGTGRVQPWGGPIEEIRAGDVVRIPAGRSTGTGRRRRRR